MSKDKITLAKVAKENNSIEELQDLGEGDWVEYADGKYGVITGAVDGPLNWPTGEDETTTIEDQGDGKQIYIVAKVDGGAQPYTEDELNKVDRETVIGDEEDMPDEPEEDIKEESELSQERIKYKMVEELINVPAVDDPGVGFDSWPDSWEESEKPARLIALDAWSSMGGTWRGCFAEIGSRRICSAFKDEILGTERWRNRF